MCPGAHWKYHPWTTLLAMDTPSGHSLHHPCGHWHSVGTVTRSPGGALATTQGSFTDRIRIALDTPPGLSSQPPDVPGHPSESEHDHPQRALLPAGKGHCTFSSGPELYPGIIPRPTKWLRKPHHVCLWTVCGQSVDQASPVTYQVTCCSCTMLSPAPC